jgi:hypothetical protein
MLRRTHKQGIADTGQLSNPLDAPTTEIIAEIWHIFGVLETPDSCREFRPKYLAE